MSRPNILLVEDEQNIARGLVFNLEEEDYRVVYVETGEDALEKVAAEQFDLVVLDLMLPGISGLEVCRRLRNDDPRLPILVLTARSGERDRVQGLSLGADDYLTKPFSLDEFLLRVRGMLRRSRWYREPEPMTGSLEFGGNRVDLVEGRAGTAQGELTLTEQELKLLRAFADREGKLVERSELLQAAWGVAPDTETRTLDNFVVRLRKYFEEDPARPKHFLTVRGRGYRFVRQPED